MKAIQVLSTAILFLLPAATIPVYAQAQEKAPEQKQQEKAKPAQQQAKPAQQPQRAQQQAKPAQQPQRAQQQAKPAQQPQHAQQQAKPAQQPQRAQQQAKPAQQPQRAQQQAKPAQQPQRAQQQAKPAQSAGHGSIPEDRFRASFGRGHTFHVSRSEFSGGSGRFQYGGFSFAMVDPWPVAWLYTDNVYVDYMNGGYFLCDLAHPGVYLSINVG